MRPAGKILITGASGRLGQHVARSLSERGWNLRLTDVKPWPVGLPPAPFVEADLSDEKKVLEVASGCVAILHFGGSVQPGPFETVIGPNIRGTYHVYEAARRLGARVLLASSNHAVGFHERTTVLDAGCQYRPDTFYGVSKVFAEVLARLYWDKHGVESVVVRIGACFDRPTNLRTLSTWLSRDDLVSLMECALTAESTEYSIVWGASNNSDSWWRSDDRKKIGWTPKDSADAWRAEGLEDVGGIGNRYQGGGFCDIDYSRV